MKYDSIYNRLRRIEGQIRGIGEMIAKEKPEDEILIQLSAAISSLSSTRNALVKTMLLYKSKKDIVLSEENIDLILKLL